jgi:hypothetical protein
MEPAKLFMLVHIAGSNVYINMFQVWTPREDVVGNIAEIKGVGRHLVWDNVIDKYQNLQSRNPLECNLKLYPPQKKKQGVLAETKAPIKKQGTHLFIVRVYDGSVSGDLQEHQRAQLARKPREIFTSPPAPQEM